MSNNEAPQTGVRDFPPLTFGIYPGGVAGTEYGVTTGPTDEDTWKENGRTRFDD
jgi:hypothetical protein